jgi:hypothetical protein
LHKPLLAGPGGYLSFGGYVKEFPSGSCFKGERRGSLKHMAALWLQTET